MKKYIETIFAKNFAKNHERKIILGSSDAWSTSNLSQQTSEPVYYIVDCRIFSLPIKPDQFDLIQWNRVKKFVKSQGYFLRFKAMKISSR